MTSRKTENSRKLQGDIKQTSSRFRNSSNSLKCIALIKMLDCKYKTKQALPKAGVEVNHWIKACVVDSVEGKLRETPCKNASSCCWN